MQRVQVAFDGGAPRYYTYDVPEELGKLSRNDRVVLPPSWANADYSFGTVMLDTSEYAGDVKRVAGVVDPVTHDIRYADDVEVPE